MKISSASQHFDAQLQADGKSEHTRGAYIRDLEKFKGWLHTDPDIVNITPDTLARFFASEIPETKPAISTNRTKTALRVFFQFLTDAGHLESNPARLIKNGRTEQKSPAHFTTSEVKRLTSVTRGIKTQAAKRDHALLIFLLHTGVRLGSAVGLRVCDISLSQRTAQINGKGGARQSVYLTASVRNLVKSYIRASRLASDDPLFPSAGGNHISSRQVQLRFKHWLGKAGITRRLTVHSLRHYAESWIMPSR